MRVFKINRDNRLVAVELPPIKRMVLYHHNKPAFLRFPEHIFIVHWNYSHLDRLFHTVGSYPIKLLLKIENKYYFPKLSDSNITDLHYCINYTHTNVYGDNLEHLLIKTIDHFWASKFGHRPLCVDIWEKATREKRCVCNTFEQVAEPRNLYIISAEELRKIR